MKIFFDTSVLVAAVVDQLPQHRDALEELSSLERRNIRGCCSTHAIAEAYATLTSLPLLAKIKPLQAKELIEVNFIPRLEVVALSFKDYLDVLGKVAHEGLRSGMIYDALHIHAAEAAGCQKLCTYNIKHFRRIPSTGMKFYRP